RHGELVVVAEPAVHVDGADFGLRAGFMEDVDNAADGRLGQGGHIFAEVDGKVGHAVVLVAGDRRPRHFAQYPVAYGVQALAAGRARLGIGPIMGFHAPGGAVVRIVEGAVLAHHRAHRPHARDVVAPARGAAGNGHDHDAGGFQPHERRVGGGQQASVGGQGAVDDGAHNTHRCGNSGRHGCKRLHGGPCREVRVSGCFRVIAVGGSLPFRPARQAATWPPGSGRDVAKGGKLSVFLPLWSFSCLPRLLPLHPTLPRGPLAFPRWPRSSPNCAPAASSCWLTKKIAKTKAISSWLRSSSRQRPSTSWLPMAGAWCA